MNMHSSIETSSATAESIGCVHDLLIAALEIIDELDLPGDIGAHLDHAIHKLGKHCPNGRGASLMALLT